MALSAARNTPGKGLAKAILDYLDMSTAANAKLFPGGMVQKNAAGYGVAAAATAGNITAGVLDPELPSSVVDNTGGSDGAIPLRVAQGVFRLTNSATTDALAQTDIFRPCYVVDDATVAKTDGGGVRPVAGIVLEVDSQGVWVFISAQVNALALATLGQLGLGNPEEISANGALSIVRRTSRLTVSGTKAWTLADGLWPGQRKTLFCVSAASTPSGVVTPAHASGFTTITFGAGTANASVELEWDASLGTPAWKLVGVVTVGTLTIA